MQILIRVLCSASYVYALVFIANVIFSWFPTDEESVLHPWSKLVSKFTEPVLAPIRRLIPPVGVGSVAMDVSILVPLLVLTLLVPAILGCARLA